MGQSAAGPRPVRYAWPDGNAFRFLMADWMLVKPRDDGAEGWQSNELIRERSAPPEGRDDGTHAN